MVPAKKVPVGNSTALPESVIKHTPYTLAHIVKTILSFSEHEKTKPLITTPAKKRYSGCKNNCADVK
jgi:hypothetical protein